MRTVQSVPTLASHGDRAYRADPALVAVQDGALLAGGRVPDPDRAVKPRAGQHVAGHGDRAHSVDPGLVAFQNSAFAVWPHRSPSGAIGHLTAVRAIAGTQVLKASVTLNKAARSAGSTEIAHGVSRSSRAGRVALDSSANRGCPTRYLVTVAEDARFELARGCPQHAFQYC